MDQIIKNPDIALNTVEYILSITKEDSSKGAKLEIDYAGTDKQFNKILITTNKILITDERKVTVDFMVGVAQKQVGRSIGGENEVEEGVERE